MRPLLTPFYLGNLQYYSTIACSKSVCFEQNDHYEKQSYRNRCRILSANGPIDLSIPIIKPHHGKCLSKEVTIADTDWQRIHWKTIEAAYNSSPFLEYYKDELLPFYTKKYKYLLDYTLSFQEMIFEVVGIKTDYSLTASYESQEPAFDLRSTYSPKREDKNYKPTAYYQVFHEKFGFVPNLSIIDLLLNMGNETILTLENTQL